MYAFSQSGQGAVSKNGIVDSHSGYCVLCQKLSFCVCQRCGDFYCSPECQRKDWQRHRYICMPLPALIHASAFFESSLLIKTQAQPNFAVGGMSPIPTMINQPYALNSVNPQQQPNKQSPNHQQTNQQPIQKEQQQLNQKQQQQPIQKQQLNQKQQPQPIQKQQSQPIPKQQQPIQKQQPLPNQQNDLKKIPQKQPMQEENQKQQTPQTQNHQTNKQNQTQIVKPAPQNLVNATYNQQNKKHVRPTSTKFPASNSRVVLSGFRSANRCYVRELDSAINDAYCKVIEKVNSYGKQASKLQLKPNTNSYAITNRDGAMHRVQILPGRQNGTSNRYRVLFIDYGYIALRNMEDLYEISEEIIELPLYIVMVQLKGVRNYAMSEDVNAWLSQFEGSEYKIFYDKGHQNFDFEVDLINWETNKNFNNEVRLFCSNKNIYEAPEMRSRSGSNASTWSIFSDAVSESRQPEKITNSPVANSLSAIQVGNANDSKKESVVDELLPQPDKIIAVAEKLIAESIQAPPKSTMIAKLELAMKNNSKQMPVLNPPFEHKKLPITQNDLTVFIVDISNIAFGYIGCFDVCEGGTLSTIQEYLGRFKDDKPYTPVLQEYVIAKFEDDWYRAKVLSVVGGDVTKFTVIFIDFTNESTLTSENIRRYPMDLKYNCHTNFCLIDDLPKSLDDQQVQFLKTKLSTNSTLLVNSVSYPNEDLACIKCDALIRELNGAA